MNKQILKEAGINYDDALRRFANNSKLYEKYLLGFLNEPHYTQMIEEIEKNDIEAAFKTAHSLKGIIGTLGMEDFFQCLYDLVEALRNPDEEKIKLYYEKIKMEHDRVVKALEEAGQDA